jgi:hypothetical protein
MPKAALKKVIKLWKESEQEVVDALQTPFSETTKHAFLKLLHNDGKAHKDSKYRTFDAFAFHVSKHRYIPSKNLHSLVPKLEATVAEIQEITLSISSLHVGTLKKISPHGYVGITDDERTIFVCKYGDNIRAYTLTSVLRTAMYILLWACDLLPLEIRYKSMEPDHHFSKSIANKLAKDVKDADCKTYAFYAKHLIPLTVENMPALSGFIMTNFIESETSSSTGSNDERCVICLCSLRHGHSRMLDCGHMFHCECLAQFLLIDGKKECLICKKPLGDS